MSMPNAAFMIKNTVEIVICIIWNIINYNIIKSNWLHFKYTLKCNRFLWCKAEFSAFLKSSLSQDPSEIIYSD